MSRARKIIAPEATPENRKVTLVEEDNDPKADRETPEHRRALNRAEARKQLVSIADQLAGDPLFFKNYRYPDANRHYPEDVDAMMRFVSRYYPHSKPAPLYVDEPRSLLEVKRCEEKRALFKKMKLRYVVLNREYLGKDGLMVKAADLFNGLEQLGE